MPNYWIQLLHGVAFEPQAPDPALIDPRTIITWYSRQLRFSNHARVRYTVAQHILNGLEWLEDESLAVRRAWVLHDAHEAYTGWGDLTRPAKNQLNSLTNGFVSRIEAGIDVAIATRFQLDTNLFQHPLIKETDNRMLATEARDLLEKPPRPWDELPKPYPNKIRRIWTSEDCQRLLTGHFYGLELLDLELDE